MRQRAASWRPTRTFRFGSQAAIGGVTQDWRPGLGETWTVSMRPACAQLPLTAVPAAAFTRSRISLPGLKCGRYFPARATGSPVFGLRPIRGGRKRRAKLPKPRISIRAPAANASVMRRNTALTASSTSCPSRWGCCFVRRSISSDFVIVQLLHETPARARAPVYLIVLQRICEGFGEIVLAGSSYAR